MNSLVELAESILQRVEDTYTAHSVPLPARRFWVAGTPVADCECLAVSFTQMYLGMPGDEASIPQRCEVPRSAVFTVSVFRCTPVEGQQRGEPPSVEAMQAASAALMVDCWLLMEAAATCSELWDPGGLGLGVIATTSPGEAQGGLQPAILNLTLAVP